jgi:putative endonuclease
VVIVEVKARSGQAYGTALEAIGPRKVSRLRAAALWWLADRGLLPCGVRFDVVAVALDEEGQLCSLEHLVDALEGGS